ncbi:MAG: glycosyltransferase [Desulfocapsaceae bacterium]|nr:glycosyltransferase [Desulfocapsaceae bacterium]
MHVLSVQDGFTQEDLPAWHPVVPEIFPCIGPSNFGYSPALKKRLDTFSSDILHIHGLWMYQSLAGLRFCRKKRVPHVVSAHGMLSPWALGIAGLKKKIAGALYENRNLNNAFCLHALNEAEAKAMRLYGLKRPICQIPNGIDTVSFQKEAPPPWKDSIERGKKVLLFLGRIHPIKGLPVLLHAWKKVQNSGDSSSKDWSLAIVGWDQNDHEEELKKLCRELGIEGSVHFLGPLFNQQKSAAYQNADAFVLPSLSEGVPISLLEAWAHALPVLMTPQCNLQEGFSCDAAIPIQQSSEDMRKGLLRVMNMSSTDLRAMGERGLSLVEAKYTWAKITADLFSVYEWVLGGGAPPSCVL